MATKMPRAVVDLDDFAESDNIMIYADTGVGKTELVSQLPGRVLVLSSENGTSVIKRSMARRGAPASEAKRFKVWPIRKFQDMEDAYAWVRDNPGNFDWVAIDSATSVQQRAMRAAMEIAVGRNPEKRDIDLPDRGEHQKMQNAMKRMIADFNELPENILWLAQAMRREDKDGNEIVVPFIMGKDYEVSAFACAQMQAFGYMMKKPNRDTKGMTDRVIIWDSFVDGGGVNYWSKDRYDAFPKICLMSTGTEQKMVLGHLLDMITASGKAKAVKAVETRDDEGTDEADIPGIEGDPDDVDVDEDEEDEFAERRAELMSMTRVKLAAALKAVDLDPKDFKGVSLEAIVENIIEGEADVDPEEDEEGGGEPPEGEKDSDDAEADEDEQDDDAEDEVEARRLLLMSCTPIELKNAVEAAGMTVAEFKGVPRPDIVEAVLEAEADAEEVEDNEDEPEDGEDELDLDGMTEDEPDEDEPAPPAAKKTAAPKKAATKAAATRRFRASDEDA